MKRVGVDDMVLLDELEVCYQGVKGVVEEMKSRLVAVEEKILNCVDEKMRNNLLQARGFLQRSYGLGLTSALIVNIVFSALDPLHLTLDTDARAAL